MREKLKYFLKNILKVKENTKREIARFVKVKGCNY